MTDKRPLAHGDIIKVSTGVVVPNGWPPPITYYAVAGINADKEVVFAAEVEPWWKIGDKEPHRFNTIPLEEAVVFSMWDALFFRTDMTCEEWQDG